MLLQTEHVSKQFNGIYALRDINLSLRAGRLHDRNRPLRAGTERIC